MSIDIDAEVENGMQGASAAADQDRITAIQNGDKIGATAGDHMPVKDWMSNLPKNITVGVMDAARNTVDAANSFGAMLDNWQKQGDRSAREQGVDQGGPPQPSAQDLRMAALERGSATDVTADHPFAGHASFRAAYQSLRDELASGSTTSDEVTQSISQFAIPMLGWTKLLGVQKAISLAGFGAEALTASTALDPHGGRNADLIATGKTVEGKLGDALSTISPDGSALNAYINYMTDRTNESEAEGRFKNVIDSLVTTASGASLIKTGATTIKAARGLPSYIAQNAGTGPVGAAAQVGAVGDLSRPALRQGADPAESIYREQARRDAEAAAAAPPGAKRPPLRQGTDPAESIYREQARQDAARFAVVHAADAGEHTATIAGIGEAHAQENGNYLQMKRIDVNPTSRGKGAGVRLVSALVDQAKAKGLTYASDVSVSPDAARVYFSLERRGYTVKKNPSHVNPNTGNLVSEDPRVPVFEVTSPEKH